MSTKKSPSNNLILPGVIAVVAILILLISFSRSKKFTIFGTQAKPATSQTTSTASEGPGQSISLRASTGYVSSIGSGKVAATAKTVGATETFTLISGTTAGSYKISDNSGNYLTAANDSVGTVSSTMNSQDWTIESNDGHTVALKNANGNYLMAESDGGLTCNSPTIGDGNSFYMNVVAEDTTIPQTTVSSSGVMALSRVRGTGGVRMRIQMTKPPKSLKVGKMSRKRRS